MPDNPQQNLPLSPTPGTPSTASGGTPTAAAPSAPSPSEVWRAGPDAPVWARGKTADEIMQVTNQLMESVVRPGQAQPAAQPSPVNPQPSYDPQAYTTGQDVENIVQRTAATFQPALERLAEQTATAIYHNTARDPRYQDVFQKYGPEVTQYLARIPKGQWTVDIVEGAAKLVRADHLDELARERANQIVQGMEPTIRPTGGGSPPQALPNDLSLKSEKLPQDWRERAQKVGLDERTLDEFCIVNGMTREQFFRNFEKSLIVEVGKVKGV